MQEMSQLFVVRHIRFAEAKSRLCRGYYQQNCLLRKRKRCLHSILRLRTKEQTVEGDTFNRIACYENESDVYIAYLGYELW